MGTESTAEEREAAMIGPLVLHSVSYAGLWGQAALDLDNFLDKAAELGFDGVMLMAKRPHLSLLDYGSKERAYLRSRLEKLNLQAACIAAYTNFTADLEHGDIPHLEIQVHHVTELARMANELGSGLVRVFTGYEHPAAGFTRQWRLVVDALRECARRAAEFGVTIGVQNHHDIAADADSLHDLIQAVGEPNCKAIFDAWAPALHGDNLEAVGRKMGGIAVHTTVANYVIRRRFEYDPSVVNFRLRTPLAQAVPIDAGIIDYRAFLSGLCAAGYTGAVAYEICSPLIEGGEINVLDSYALRFLDWMRGLRSESAKGIAGAAAAG